ncbi:DUF4893 domain-containing protein [Labrys miyagiensis]|uniref:DUF4893 domain-containing protein n=1 Tax=Labrys miyagiensis TaxID=346912 RepID=UPI0024E0F9DC|nr:DUF4893 domain-containing protein [Labrys miyagiensis]
MRIDLRIAATLAWLAIPGLASAAGAAGFDPTPRIPVKIEDADHARFLDFDATRQRTIAAALAGTTGDDGVALQKIVLGEPVAITSESDLIGNWRCRSAQLSDGSQASDHKGGAYIYTYFKCAIHKKDGKLFFEKLNGSQRVSGFLYRVRDDRYAFLGGTDLAEDPQVPYGYATDRNVVAYLFKVGTKRLRLEMPKTCCSDLEILELVK